jgi:hypothetical protein
VRSLTEAFGGIVRLSAALALAADESSLWQRFSPIDVYKRGAPEERDINHFAAQKEDMS